MINAVEAKCYAEKNELSETYKFRKLCEDRILEACKNNSKWCLVPTQGYKPATIVHIFNELVHDNGYSVGQRSSDTEGRCLYIKWGHANVTVSKDK